MESTEEEAQHYGAAVWTVLALVVGLWWSLAQLELVPFDWKLTVPIAVLALAASLFFSYRAS